jgi:hypothetical protein
MRLDNLQRTACAVCRHGRKALAPQYETDCIGDEHLIIHNQHNWPVGICKATALRYLFQWHNLNAQPG